MQTQIQEKPLVLKGVYTFTVADLVHPEAWALQEKIVAARERGDHTAAREMILELNRRFASQVITVPNIIPTVGRSVLAQRLANTTTYTGIVNKVALGTGNTAPANSDTQLATESYRNNAASLTYADNIAYITGFFTATETSGTFAEAGLFIDGTGSANTGQLFSRVLVAVTKTTLQTLTIDWVLTIS